MGDYLKRWYFSYQKPTKRAYQRDKKSSGVARDNIPGDLRTSLRDKEELSILALMKPACIQSCKWSFFCTQRQNAKI
jgi:hypothetical protein